LAFASLGANHRDNLRCMALVIDFPHLSMNDVALVGGKNASLGEMISQLEPLGVVVPGGFATTAEAYRNFLEHNDLVSLINDAMHGLDVEDVAALTKTGALIRSALMRAELQPELIAALSEQYALITEGLDSEAVSWAVRSSATAEDLPEASFAGQQETFLNVRGIEGVLEAVRAVFASLYNDRAIAYRVHHGFDHSEVAISAGVQRMIRSDIGASGVMFTVDTESGFTNAVFITSSYGLGEAVVQGAVNPDEFYVYKPNLEAGRPAILKRSLGDKAVKMMYTEDRSLGKTIEFVDVDAVDRDRFSITDDEVTELARHAVVIENHYGRPMDIEWARDGVDGRLYILQARPETVTANRSAAFAQRFVLKESAEPLVEGRAIGQKIGSGTVRVLRNVAQMTEFQPGDVLVADMTDPDWEPIMKRASAIVTNRGGRTCHAAIIARELGIPAVVGATGATDALTEGAEVTVSCSQGDTGYVYPGLLEFEIEEKSTEVSSELPVKVMMNVGTPDQAFAFSMIPNDGVGLARLEFIINRQVGIHPSALLDPESQSAAVRQEIERRTKNYTSPSEFYISQLTEGIAMLAAAFAPKPVIVRMSDFKTNEYAFMLGGEKYEPQEENPMIGYRGASRYLSPDFRPAFDLECEALRRVREDMGLTNLKIMIPFVRTVDEGRQVIELLAENGLKRGENGLEVIMMCEVPSNVILADEFLDHFDGFSIGSNDLTQLTLGLDRDSAIVAHLFDERNEAVKRMMQLAIRACKAKGKYIGICGQGPSDHPDLAQWLVDEGIDSVSLNPDSVFGVIELLTAGK
jgi:pyruvate, water dikinase